MREHASSAVLVCLSFFIFLAYFIRLRNLKIINTLSERSLDQRFATPLLILFLLQIGITLPFSAEEAAAASTKCNGKTATIIGSNADDSLTGTTGDDVFFADDGDDTIVGNGGNDTVCGGKGDDTITTGSGDDWIDAGDGDDTINAGDGNNTVDGGKGDDTVTAGGGDDEINSEDGDDTIDAGEGTNTIAGGRGDDRITTGNDDDDIEGGDGADIISAGSGNNTVDGGRNDDSITSGSGADVLSGGTGDDSITAGAGNDTLSGEENDDTLDGGSGTDSCDGGTGTNTLLNCEDGSSSSSSSTSVNSSTGSSLSSSEGSTSSQESSSSSTSTASNASSANSSDASSSSEEISSSSTSISVSSETISSENSSSSILVSVTTRSLPSQDIGAPNDGGGSGHGTRRSFAIVSFLSRFLGVARLPPGSFGAGPGRPLSDAEIQFICSMQRSLPPIPEPGFVAVFGIRIAAELGRDTAFVTDQLQDPFLCTEITARRLPEKIVAQSPIPFPMGIDGLPLSRNATWNACIRGKATLAIIRSNPDRDENGHPRDCGAYSTKDEWRHPDLFIYFTLQKSPLRIILPSGYVFSNETFES